jgi:hypothetical protein
MSKEVSTTTGSTFAALSDAAAAQTLITTAREFGLDKSLLTRIKVPAGGGQFWEVETSEGVDSKKELELLIVSVNIRSRAWFRLAPDEADGSTSPDCISQDGTYGFGNPTSDETAAPAQYECASCPFAQWGSDRKGGKGQDCTVRGQLVGFLPDSLMPVIVSIPRTSIRGMQRYAMQLAGSGLYAASVVTTLTLEKHSSGGNSYSTINFRKARNLSGDEVKAVAAYKEVMAEAFGG